MGSGLRSDIEDLQQELEAKLIPKKFLYLDRLIEVSRWMLAGTVYSIYNVILDIDNIKTLYGNNNVKIFIILLSISLMFGIIYQIFKEHQQNYEKEKSKLSEQFEQDLNKILIAHGMQQYIRSNSVNIKQLETITSIESVKKHSIFFIQVLFFTLGFIVLIVNALQRL
jgi:hypothetical protein